jgi:hypothetical protein
VKANETWRRTVLIAAWVSIALICSPTVALRDAGWGALLVPFFLLPVWAPYAVVLLRLRSRKLQEVKKGLAVAVAGGSAALVLAILLAFVRHDALGFEGRTFVAGLAAFALTQTVLVAGAINTYYSLERAPGDGHLLRTRFALLGAWAFVVLLLALISAPISPEVKRIAANEASATFTLRTLVTAELTYAQTYPSGFTDGLNRLGTGGGSPNADAADLVGPVVAGRVSGTNSGFVKSGYHFTYIAGRRDAKGHISRFTISARPREYGKYGVRSFFTDESGVIRATTEDRAATVGDQAIN